MTVYLSNYWRTTNFLLCIITVCPFLIFSYIYITEPSHSFLDTITIFLIPSIYIVVFLFLHKTAIKPILKKIDITENEIVMLSSRKKQIVVDTKEKVYCEKLRLVVGKHSSQYFIVLSNSPFETFKNIKGLGAVCKKIDKSEGIIIAPYNEKTIAVFENYEWTETKTN